MFAEGIPAPASCRRAPVIVIPNPIFPDEFKILFPAASHPPADSPPDSPLVSRTPTTKQELSEEADSCRGQSADVCAEWDHSAGFSLFLQHRRKLRARRRANHRVHSTPVTSVEVSCASSRSATIGSLNQCKTRISC